MKRERDWCLQERLQNLIMNDIVQEAFLRDLNPFRSKRPVFSINRSQNTCNLLQSTAKAKTTRTNASPSSRPAGTRI
ncbi:hypothetical protein ALR00_101913, partial [Pseudomonas savastanoi pv. retacarpa]